MCLLEDLYGLRCLTYSKDQSHCPTTCRASGRIGGRVFRSPQFENLRECRTCDTVTELHFLSDFFLLYFCVQELEEPFLNAIVLYNWIRVVYCKRNNLMKLRSPTRTLVIYYT